MDERKIEAKKIGATMQKQIGTTKKNHLFIFLLALAFTLTSCGSNSTQSASTDKATTSAEQVSQAPAEGASVNNKAGQFYSITNDFLDHRGLGTPIYIHLSSVNTQQNYIVPPTQYTALKLTDAVLQEFKVEGECVQIPAEAFPVAVSVCNSRECTAIRSLDIILKTPAHYNISGVGGLLSPNIYPVSPCSEDFAKLIENIGAYK